MFNVPEARVGSLQTSLLVLRLPEPLALRSVYRMISVEEPAGEAPSLFEPAEGRGTGLPPPGHDAPSQNGYSRDELIRQRPRFATILPEFASLKTREWASKKKKRNAGEPGGSPTASPVPERPDAAPRTDLGAQTSAPNEAFAPP